MTVQRYFSTRDMRSARRSFVAGSLLGVGLNLMLTVVGLAMLYFYFGQQRPLDAQLDPAIKQHRDLIFPTFAVHHLPPGLGGGILAALLAAAMSSIDSGINSIATVLSVELRPKNRPGAEPERKSGRSREVTRAQAITLAAGLFITVAAYGLNFLPGEWGIVDAMPRTFNAITAPLGGLFLVGMFLPRVGGRAAVAATLCGLLTSIGIGYYDKLCGLLHDQGLLAEIPPALSFTWVMPSALLVTLLSALLFSLFEPRDGPDLNGLTWARRDR